MLFNSLEYAVFFAIVVLAYFALPYRYRLWLLLAASYYFYMRWRWEYVFLIVAQTLVTFETGRRISAARDPRARRAWLAVAVVFLVGLLGYFKYFNFFTDNARPLFEALALGYLVPHLDILLPLGISFHTFQTLSYVIDIYRGDYIADTHLGRYALFVNFFPQLIAGPIERATHLLEQFKCDHRFDIERATDGLKLIAWGLFKKAVIADRLALYVDRVYASPDLWSGSTLLLASFFFTFQIYCDFSGYSDIAVGSARVLGYDLMQNFRRPYLARSISDFWRRWHISLTTWFRIYVYLPAGGNRVRYRRWLFNIFVVFLLSGLWHGANWTFVIWGALHGSYYLMESLARRLNIHDRFAAVFPPVLVDLAGALLTFVLVLIGWVFFRAASVGDATFILGRIAADWNGPLYLGPSQFTTALSLVLIGILLVVESLQEKGYAASYDRPSRLPALVRWPGYVALLLGAGMLALSSDSFIYFQF